MKKYLMIAASLVAGSAFVNADPVITLTDLSQDITGGDVVYMESNGCLEGASLFSTVLDGATRRYVASATINLDLTTLGISSGDSVFSGSTELLKFCVAPDSNSGAIGLSAVSSGIQFTWQGGVYQGNYAIRWSSLLDKAYVVDGHTYVALTLQASAALSAQTKGTFVYDKDGAAFKTNAGSSNYGFSGLASTAVYDTIYLNNDYVTGISVVSGIASVGEIRSLSALVAIPEPSAFGLLAGLGVLCLVGTRRRRL
ncbi:MAG: PEP-CTERM sorting domain-containing protein [Opitutales bacterium]|nr:PEP-CTERM sorting domain-containing protein [Opitutales bacterium]